MFLYIWIWNHKERFQGRGGRWRWMVVVWWTVYVIYGGADGHYLASKPITKGKGTISTGRIVLRSLKGSANLPKLFRLHLLNLSSSRSAHVSLTPDTIINISKFCTDHDDC
ncbi:unnamed protein product [Lactuca virosa]|uniref:Uncharacterized protein n=1 Tax=Lactuca virosa TaxID=75947 RepID=A0AAU9LSE0_9ASTR|nr:unnamed protein product [Lactuca virosa]